MSDPAYKRIGDYEVMRELGRGGMGRVYKVRNVISDRVEAMKILLPELAGRQELAARFLREIKLVASLEHPNIAQLRTAMTVDDQLIMVMEFVEGQSLDQRLDDGPIAPADAVNYTRQVLAALGYAHARGVVHRDIKPANMMVMPNGTVKVMDFGIAFSGSEHKLTSTGTTLGSLAYMSPEQVKGEATDARSDLYSLGISLYEMVTGQRPFKADSDYAIMAAHVKETPRAPVELQPGLPGSLNAIILQSIAKEPSQRFQSAEAFAAALASVVPTMAQTGVMPAASVDKTVVRPSGSFDAQPTAGVAPSRSTGTLHGMTPAPTGSGPAPISSGPAAASAPRMSATMMSPAVSDAAPSAYSSSIPPPPPAAASGSSHRGLYIALGAVLAIVVLVAAGTYYQSGASRSDAPPAGPSASAPGSSAPSSQATPPASAAPADASASPASAAPAASDASQAASGSGQAAAPASSAPAGASSLAPASTTASKPGSKTGGSAQSSNPPQQTAQPAPSSAPAPAVAKPAAPDNSAELDELERTLDQMESRIVAADTGLETLRRQQRASGFDLRQDISIKQDAMKLNFNKAKQALQAKDLARAKRFTDLAESNLGAVEKFLGR